ncbi:hypothetical protein EVAR_72647_1 [Eumeta japonica]|uniref:Uncharacterized protein n=1 Tax=Eumeta variegata TaxID=151549 RepID=A0A4C1SJU6_EUMVA|nr:hypothetical protein EVAR_72647_1 [Eumeta japonica]
MKLGIWVKLFVEECPEEDVEELPDNLATSPIPTNHFPDKYLKINNIEPTTDKEMHLNYGWWKFSRRSHSVVDRLTEALLRLYKTRPKCPAVTAHHDITCLRIARDELQLPLPLPRRNSIDFSKETPKGDEN